VSVPAPSLPAGPAHAVDTVNGTARSRSCSPDRYIVACPISIETMPILHFHPGARFLQISTTGCNFDCPGCVSTVIVREMAPDSSALLRLTPEEVVQRARDSGCSGIAFLMNDPLAGLPSFIEGG